jgi:hypothetical protein
MIDLVGHIGYISILIGMILLSKKNKAGWIFRFAGETIWSVLGLILGLTSIWVWGSVFMAIDVFAFLKWSANEQATKP